ncbi:hypothetical protein CDCA_CDCA14G3862 [Cyanidium caldarium]|uniref:Trafficking protein particle complex subunit n=1 Tax=Cyanidium caldarium TaxID=2771 RepID=A0AAV9IZT4_CYACA|nr:hypothetical protein CDCA_CDCA14G3862 [Cyanidium caldarium]
MAQDAGRGSGAPRRKVSTLPANFSGAALTRLGEQASQRAEQVNGELAALTYGALVRQLVVDYEDPGEVNVQLERLGYNIGLRLADDFLARSGAPPCRRFVETSEVIARVAFRMYLGVSARVASVAEDGSAYSVVFEENPLADFVEMPTALRDQLWFSNLLCGAIRGALEMVQYVVSVSFVRDVLRGDAYNEIRVALREQRYERAPPDEEL